MWVWLVAGAFGAEDAAEPGPAPAGAGRLADPVRPVAQRVALTIDPTIDTFEGTTTIVLEVAEKTAGFSLHADEIDIVSVATGKPGRRAKPARATPGEHGLLRIDANKPLRPGLVEVHIAFAGALREQTYGLYRFEVDGEWYVASQFEADEARTAWPCFDEPSFKIPLQLAVTAPEGHAVIGNAPVAAATEGPAMGDRASVVTTLARTDPIPTYAAALLVGPYERTPIEGMPVPGAVYTVKGRSANAATVVSSMPGVLADLEAWFGTPQPYPKIDVILVPRFSFGAMENPGAIVARERFLPPPDRATPDQAHYSQILLAHELAHFWFGDLVTMRWWDDLWLNESFAEWLGHKIAGARDPMARPEIGRVERLSRMLQVDGMPSARPVRTEVDPAAVFETVNFAFYRKGEALLDMVEGWIGEEAVRSGLQRYLADHAWGNATASDLFEALGEASGQDVSRVMDPFLEGEGAPHLRFTRSDRRLRIAVEPLSLLGEPLADRGPWVVPVRVRVGRPDGSSEVVAILVEGEEEAEIDLGEGEIAWWMPAADGKGYYAWSVPDADLDALIAARAQLAPAERAALLAMLRLQYEAGQRSLGDLVARAGRFVGDADPAIVSSALDQLDAIEITDVIGDPELTAAADAFVVETLRPALDRVGLQPVADEPPAETGLRARLLSALARAGDPEIGRLGTDLGRVIADGDGEVDPSLVWFGLRAYAEGAEDFEATQQALWTGAAEATDPALRRQLLGASGLVAGTEALQRALDRALDPATPADDAATILFGGVLRRGREAERDLVLDRAMASHDALLAIVPPVRHKGLARLGGGCSFERYERAAAFYAHPDRYKPGIDDILAQVRAGVGSCRKRLDGAEASLRAMFDGEAALAAGRGGR